MKLAMEGMTNSQKQALLRRQAKIRPRRNRQVRSPSVEALKEQRERSPSNPTSTLAAAIVTDSDSPSLKVVSPGFPNPVHPSPRMDLLSIEGGRHPPLRTLILSLRRTASPIKKKKQVLQLWECWTLWSELPRERSS